MTKPPIPYLMAILAAGVPACATDPADPVVEATARREYDEYPREQVRCDQNFCVITAALDTDDDGTPDEDERATGTDPLDPWSYPAVADLASLLPTRAMPSFEAGNAALIVLPTIGPDGLSIFGGAATLPGRQRAAELAGIRLPDGMDISGGATLSRTFDGELNIGGVMFGIGKAGEHGIATSAAGTTGGLGNVSDVQEVYRQGSNGYEFSQYTAYSDLRGPVTVTTETGPGYQHSVAQSETGGYTHESTSKTEDDGSTTDTDYTSTTATHTTSSGATTTTTTTTSSTTHTSPDGSMSFNTTTTTTTKTDPDGTKTTQTSKTSTVCSGGECSKNADPVPAGEVPADDGTATAWRDPDYVGEPMPRTIHLVIAAMQSNITVVNTETGSRFEYLPEKASNKWGPVGLFTGDDGTGTPSVIRLPGATPDYDPNFNDGMPPRDIPDNTCLYCFQP